MPYVEINGQPGTLEQLFDNAPTVTRLRAWGRDLVALPPELPICDYFRLGASPLATELPRLPVAEHVSVWGCPALPFLASRPSSLGEVFTAVHARGAWKICIGEKVIGIGGLRVRWGAGTNPRKPDGNPDTLALAEEVWRKVLAAHPEAAEDENADDDAFYRFPEEERTYGAMRNVEQGVRALVNLGRALRGESPIPERGTPLTYDQVER